MKIVDQAPIIEVAATDANTAVGLFARQCLAFGRSLDGHGSAVIRRHGKPDFNVAESATKAASMASDPDYFGFESGSDDRLFCYMIGGFPVGVMMCRGDNYGYENIDALACNPGLSACGGALIERAVDSSMDNGREGRVSVLADLSHLLDIYALYGFVEDDVGTADMVLEPNDSPKWQLIGIGNPFHTQVELRYRLTPPLSYIGD